MIVTLIYTIPNFINFNGLLHLTIPGVLERLFSWMCSRVSPESGALIGGVLALCAKKWLLTTVNPHLIPEAAQHIAWEVAMVATVGLLFIIQRLLGAFCRFVCISMTYHSKDLLSGNWKQCYRRTENKKQNEGIREKWKLLLDQSLIIVNPCR